MSSTGVGLLDLAQARLGWIDRRQDLLARNIANADTPAYQPRDLPDFASTLHHLSVTPTLTNPLHLAGLRASVPLSQPIAGEQAPDGNAVDVEDQLTRIAQDETAQATVTNLWKTYMGMFATALGHAG